ncbi:ATP-binding protein [Mucilaginibacter sp. BT774]|uniref:ATP-binding protein n=1 Tax=Mucilaginibacter sp. BT774 TaxID=3062276 RepID=UPI0026776542|nr:ATP-binding protein [Mucilaginibacter sp. BT774]MDO3624618.1 ATP-binding protein [Mucilaginibacter sp. BT774]
MRRNRPFFAEKSAIHRFLIWSEQRKNRPFYARYSLPLILVIIATLFKLQFLGFINASSPFLLYFAIVCLCTIMAGIGPAIVAIILAAVTADYFFLAPNSEFKFTSLALYKISIFFAESTFIILISSVIMSAYRRVNQIQALFRAMIEKGSEGIVLTNREGKRVYVSPSIERVIGYTADEFLVMEPWILADPEELPEMKAYMEDLLAHPGKNISFTHRMKHKDGRWIWIENSITNLLDDESVCAVVANFYNVTDRVILEQKKDDFIGIASHELKTPITSLKASIQLLDRMKAEPSHDMVPKLITRSKRSVEKLTELVDELLNASNIGQGHLHLHKTNFVIADLLVECCHHIHAVDKYKLVIQGDKEIRVCADKGRIDQVVVNFVNNAIKYAPQSKDIILSVERVYDEAKVSVKDNGPGVAPEKLPYVFDRYYRAEVNNFNSTGLGLGLYISSEIIKKHGGQIGVESKPGEGSTFWFTLPV